MIKYLALGVTVLSSVVVGGVAADMASAPEAAAACYGSVSIWKGKNNSCGSARHWDAIRNSKAKYGPWVGRGRVSAQSACWANVVSYGMTAR